MSAASRAGFRAALAALLILTFATDRSTAAGNWTIETVGTALAPQPSLTLDAAGVPYIAHNSGAQPRLASRASGAWTGESLVTPQPGPLKNAPAELNLIYFVTPSLALEGSGAPWVLYYKAPEADVWFAKRALGTWNYERLSTDGSAPTLAIDPAGTAHVVFYDQTLGPRYGVLGSGGWAWEPAPGTGPLALDVAGRPQVAFSTGTSGGAIHWATRGTGGWTVETCEAVGGFGLSLALDGSGEPHVAFSDIENQRIRYARRVGSAWTVETVAANVSQYVTTSIALGAGGEPFIAYYDATGGDFCFARRTGGVWRHEVIEHAYNTNDVCSLAIDAWGRPHVAYFVPGVNLVRYATTSEAVTDVGPGVSSAGFALTSAAPNPLRAGGALDLALRLDGPRRVTVELLDLAGRRVAVREPAELGPGIQHLRWSPRVADGGLYFLQVCSDRGERRTSRLALIP